MGIFKRITGMVITFSMIAMVSAGAVTAEDHIHTPSDDPADITYAGASCTIGGYAIISCSECGEVADIQIVDALGHDWHEEDVPATCKAEGYHLKKCLRGGCGLEYKTDYTPVIDCIPSTDPLFDFSTTATCTEDGERMILCSMCGSVAVNEVIPATGHNWVDVGTPATCTGYGQRTIKCSFCGDIDVNEVLDPLGHHMVSTVIAPTCDERGYTLMECDRDGCTNSRKVNYKAALGHKNPDGTDAWSEPYISLYPTEDAVGQYSEKCGLCGDEQICGEIAKLTDGDFMVIDGELLWYQGNDAEAVIPEYVTAIAAGAFANCEGITGITVPKEVTSLAAGAFDGCSADTTVYCYKTSATAAFVKEHGIKHMFLTLRGDVDGDDLVTAVDANTLARALTGAGISIGVGADLNGDGSISAVDYNVLLRLLSGANV